MRRCLLDFGCAIVAVNVFVVLLCHDLTTAESRVKAWYQQNAFKPPQWLRLLSVLRRWFCCWLLPLFVGVLYLVLVLLFSTLCPSSFAITLMGCFTLIVFLLVFIGSSSPCRGLECSV